MISEKGIDIYPTFNLRSLRRFISLFFSSCDYKLDYCSKSAAKTFRLKSAFLLPPTLNVTPLLYLYSNPLTLPELIP